MGAPGFSPASLGVQEGVVGSGLQPRAPDARWRRAEHPDLLPCPARLREPQASLPKPSLLGASSLIPSVTKRGEATYFQSYQGSKHLLRRDPSRSEGW